MMIRMIIKRSSGCNLSAFLGSPRGIPEDAGWNQLRKTEESSEGAVSRGENGLRRFLCARSMSSSLRRTGEKAQVNTILYIYIYICK